MTGSEIRQRQFKFVVGHPPDGKPSRVENLAVWAAFAPLSSTSCTATVTGSTGCAPPWEMRTNPPMWSVFRNCRKVVGTTGGSYSALPVGRRQLVALSSMQYPTGRVAPC